MRCKAITKKGRQCQIDADPGSDLCHMHNPQGKLQRQQRGEIPRGKPSPKGRRVGRPSQSERPSNPQAILWADGLAEPNPGLGTFGWIARADGRVIDSGRGLIGERVTNNEAEFQALIEALGWAVDQNLMRVIVYMDSKLVVNLVRGRWKCKAPHLLPLMFLAWRLANDVLAYVVWLPRESNTEADALSRQAYNESMAALSLEPEFEQRVMGHMRDL